MGIIAKKKRNKHEGITKEDSRCYARTL